MVQELLPLIPSLLTTIGLLVCAAGLFAGVVLWLAGGIWSRGIITLAAVTLGGWLGMMLPRCFYWPINSMALAVLGAVGLGLFAFAAPRLWVGLLLGIVLAGWLGLGVWVNLGADEAPVPPQDAQVQDWMQSAQDLWQRLPEPVQRILPYAAATGLISGLAIALLWPRLARAACFSLTGATLALISALVLIAVRRPDWLMLIPEQADVQTAALVVMALVGIVIQWQMIPSKKQPPPREEPPPESARLSLG